MADTGPGRACGIGGDAPIPETGTEIADKDKIKSLRPIAGEAVAVSWGGSRNRVDRTSDCLTPKQAESIVAAIFASGKIGLPVNRHVTLHLEKLGVAAGAGAAAIGAFLKLHRDYLATRGLGFASVWIREDDSGDGSKGAHVHILMHVDPDAAPAVTRRQRRWLRLATGKPYCSGALHTSRIGGKVHTATSAPAVYHDNLKTVVVYLLKGAGPDAAAALVLPRHGEGGPVIGKRCGWSQNIGEAARRRAGVSRGVRAGVI